MEKKLIDLRNHVKNLTPVANRAIGVKFNPEKTLAQIQQMSDNSLIQLFRLIRSELKSRKEDFALAAHQQEQRRQLEADKTRKDKLDLQKLIEHTNGKRNA